MEYKAEEAEVLDRLKASVDDPLALENAGFALFDMYPERRGNLYSEEVYRVQKSHDATLEFNTANHNHKFSTNDVIVITEQPNGSGDFFGADRIPTSPQAVTAEARVLSTGPDYIDLVMMGGAFEAAFGPAPNDYSKEGNKKMRLRIDRFFSNIPYQRMVNALSMMTAVPTNKAKKASNQDGIMRGGGDNHNGDDTVLPFSSIQMDEVLKEIVLSTFCFNEASSLAFRDTDQCNLRELSKKLAKPPMPNSPTLTNQALKYMQTNPHGIFPKFNGPQLTAIGAALTRRMTMIQGPPGTGKTTVASAIAFGFVHQCRNLSAQNTKVLATAFSNVGADNLAESILQLGLKVVRVGKASAVTSPLLRNHTLDAHIDADPVAQKALRNAASATSQLHQAKRSSNKKTNSNHSKGKGSSNAHSNALQIKRDLATAAVKHSIRASNVAATKALREADVIVCTSTGALDPRLMAACGLGMEEEEVMQQEGRYFDDGTAAKKKFVQSGTPPGQVSNTVRTMAPDGRPPLSLPFVLIDEACQSVEPASLIPLCASNSCRSLVLLGDPCQLPPTVRSSPTSPLSVSLMERLAVVLPQPIIVTAQNDDSQKDTTFLNSKPTKQAVSLLKVMDDGPRASYRKRFAGSLLLSVQYRMHPSISAFSSAIFYDSLLSTPAFMAGIRPFPPGLLSAEDEFVRPPPKQPASVRFVNVPGRCHERRGSMAATRNKFAEVTSYRNHKEAEQVIEVLKNIRQEHPDRTVGVITPYTGQVELIRQLMIKESEKEGTSTSLLDGIDVKSVDGYQGRERDIVVFSAVRSNRRHQLGFLTDWRRMNVALTRARMAMVIVGDLDTLAPENSSSGGDPHWAALGKWCRAFGCVVEAKEKDGDCDEN